MGKRGRKGGRGDGSWQPQRGWQRVKQSATGSGVDESETPTASDTTGGRRADQQAAACCSGDYHSAASGDYEMVDVTPKAEDSQPDEPMGAADAPDDGEARVLA